MLSDRLTLALDADLFDLPATGRIAVINPQIGTDLSALPKDQTQIVTRFFPAYQAFRDAGFDTSVAPAGPYTLAILCLPRAKAEARAMVAAAAPQTNGPLVIDGQKTDGIDSFLKAMRQKTETSAPLAKAHGKVFVAENADFSDWVAPPPAQLPNGFITAAGVFSADGIDPGSQLLINALPAKLPGHVIDLGAGWGLLADAALKRNATSIDLVEADHTALEAAKQNIHDACARFHWTDALTFKPDAPADHVLCNPPFHTTRKADPALGQNFIRAAARILKRDGTLWLVANRHLPYEQVLEDTFREIETLGQTPQYKLTRAAKPRTSLKGKR